MTSERTIDVSILKENGVIRFTFHDFSRQTIDAWVEYVTIRDGKLRAPLRVIYDFQNLGLPTPYMNQKGVEMMSKLQIPEDTRTAYLVDTLLQITYYRLLARRMPKTAGAVQAFLREKDAIAWLTQP